MVRLSLVAGAAPAGTGGLSVRNHWTNDDERTDGDELPRERDSNSSVQSQYEDTVLPDREWEHEDDS